jgi:hypothetical protein
MSGRRWGRVSSVSAGIVAGVMSLAVCSTAAQAAPLCVVHGHSVRGVRTSKIVELTGKLIVYRTSPKSEEYAPKSTDVWACGRKSNRFVAIAVEESNEEYGTEGVLSGFHVAGNWLIVSQENGQTEVTECEKYEAPDSEDNCPSTNDSLLVVNVASGLEGSISPGNLPAGTAMLSADGAMVWWSQTQGKEKEATASLYGCVTATAKRKLVCKPHLVAQGAIPAASVRLVGTTLNWTAAGEPQSSVL